MQSSIEKIQRYLLSVCGKLLLVFCCLLFSTAGSAYAITVTDSGGYQLTFKNPPVRIVSLVPGVTEIIAKLKADQALVGITYHTTRPARLSRCMVVGGFMAPSLKRIKALNPDLDFISSMHEDLRAQLATSKCQVVEVSTSSLAVAYSNIKLVGNIVGKKLEAVQLVEGMQRQLALISRKVERIPPVQWRRVMLVMECSDFMVPGDDSFQNELITAAGGIPPVWGKKGVALNIDEEALRAFDPQFIYANGSCRQKVRKFFTDSVWADVAAVKSKNISFFPDALTGRAATHIDDFVAWLAATIYADHFSRSENIVLREEVGARRELDLKIEYVKRAEVVETTIADFNHKTLIVDLAEPMLVLSTLEGLRQQITAVANHYLPPASWGLVHQIGEEEFEGRIANLLERKPETTSMLFTGADMDNLVQQSASFKEMQVTALVTAGVSSNAVRMGAEEGRYYELEESGTAEKPGTIN
ncbi:MAG: adenosylcobinamide amidohydrolase, partial [Deltaproteobacteria bacterium]